jgi:hypothetical protein
MKIVLKKILSYCGSFPYSLTLFIVRSCAGIFGIRGSIWPRNSYVLGYLEPGFSDLDLSFVLKPDATPRVLSQCHGFVAAIRRVWPLVGEINAYIGTPSEAFFKSHNYFELRRDPYLARLSTHLRFPDPVEGAVFLFRQLEKDCNQVHQMPQRRMKKWRSHLVLIHEAMKQLELSKYVTLREASLSDDVTRAILHCMEISNPLVWNQVYEMLTAHFELMRSGVDPYKMRPLFATDSWWLAFTATRLEDLAIPPRHLSELQLKFFVRQIRWEICGCISQVHLKNAFFMRTHFEKLRSTVRKQRSIQYAEELNELLDLVDGALKNPIFESVEKLNVPLETIEKDVAASNVAHSNSSSSRDISDPGIV